MRDPVCGVQVDATATTIAQVHEGELYFFCSPACLKEFRVEPKRFAR